MLIKHLCVIITSKFWGVQSFAICKFVAVIMVSILYLKITLQILNIKLKNYVKLLSPIIVPLIFLFCSLTYIEEFLPLGKSGYNLMLVILTGDAAKCVNLESVLVSKWLPHSFHCPRCLVTRPRCVRCRVVGRYTRWNRVPLLRCRKTSPTKFWTKCKTGSAGDEIRTWLNHNNDFASA